MQKRLTDFAMHQLDLTTPTVLEKGCVYILELQEQLALPEGISARANPKSTTGRLDVFTRLITDYGTQFDRVIAGYRGPIFVEVVPRTFSILARTGDTLNQLRFMRGVPSSSDYQLHALQKNEPLLYVEDRPAPAELAQGLRLSIDLASSTIGYVARHHTDVIDLARRAYYEPLDFWDPLTTPRRGMLVLAPDEFYILASREAVRVPPAYAAELVAYDTSVGEFRIHYAGFFDPGFGYGAGEIRGARAVLEIRSHEVPFALEDRQMVGRLQYERLTTMPDLIYGRAIGSSYQGQALALSKQFRPMQA